MAKCEHTIDEKVQARIAGLCCLCLQVEVERLKEQLQNKSTDFFLTLENIAKALGIQIGREKWWDTSKKTRIEMLISKAKALKGKVKDGH